MSESEFMEIRNALPRDAAEICEVLRQSIINLCVEDHKNAPASLGSWLENKTPETIRGWIDDPSSQMLVATEGERILAVGGVMNSGEVTLNYVLPSARLRGISKKMIKALEARAKECGAKTCFLKSTATARRFYLSMGYIEAPPSPSFFIGLTDYPMSKDV